MINILEHAAPRVNFRSIHRKMLFAKSAVFVAMLLAGPLAFASLIVMTGTDNSGTDNVIANAACDPLLGGPALTVQGCLNTSHSTIVNFTSDEFIEYTGGQAAIVAQDLAFSYLNISLASGSTFNKLLLNIDANANGFVTFLGNPGGTGSSPFSLSADGENKFILTGEDFISLSFYTSNLNQVTTDLVSSVDLASDVKQVRIGGIPGVEPPVDPDVPVPGTLLLMGLGLLGLAKTRRGIMLVRIPLGALLKSPA